MGFIYIPTGHVTDQQLLDDLKRVADKLDADYVTTEEYDAQGNHSSKTLRDRFNGWGEAWIKAGLENVNPPFIPEKDLILRYGEVTFS